VASANQCALSLAEEFGIGLPLPTISRVLADGTLNWQDICKTVLSEFQDQGASSQGLVYVEVS
jgi:hypothetical protein